MFRLFLGPNSWSTRLAGWNSLQRLAGLAKVAFFLISQPQFEKGKCLTVFL
jgi:hypothetical protein